MLNEFNIPNYFLIEQASISFLASTKSGSSDPTQAGGSSQRIGKSDNKIGFFQLQVSYDDVSARTRRC